MTAQLPILPAELWTKILEHHKTEQTLPEQWLSLRHVNTIFRDAIETIFRATVLPNTWIRFIIGEQFSEEHGRVLLDTEFEFSHLSDDSQTAVFSVAEDISAEYLDQIRLEIKKSVSIGNILRPGHTLTICHDLTDGPLRRAIFDPDKLEVSLNWKETYTIFFSEVHITSELTKDWVNGQEEWMKGLSKRMEKGELTMESMMAAALKGFASSNQESAKRARRLRIHRLMKEKRPGLDLPAFDGEDKEEDAILTRLAQARQFASMAILSDEESEEDSEDEEEKEEEDDEWEDDANSDAGSQG